MLNIEKVDIIARHFAEIMRTLGLDLKDDSLKDTPKRVAKMYVNELCAGLNPINEPKITLFQNHARYDQMLVERNITVNSLCEHHFVPFMGFCDIAYFPQKKIVGLSKFHRVVNYFAQRPQVQERLTHEIAKYFVKKLGTEDIAVVIRASHLCCKIRGVKDNDSETVTSYLGGCFRDPAVRQEFFNLIK